MKKSLKKCYKNEQECYRNEKTNFLDSYLMD